MLDVVDQRGDYLLEWSRQPSLHLFRIQTRVLPRNCDHRNVDVGEDIGWRTHDHDRTHDQDEERQDDEGVRPVQS